MNPKPGLFSQNLILTWKVSAKTQRIIKLIWMNHEKGEKWKKCFHWNFLIYFTYTGLSIRARGWDFPWLLWAWPRLLSLENNRKIEPKEIPSCLIPCLLVGFTWQLEILVTTLHMVFWIFSDAIYYEMLGPFLKKYPLSVLTSVCFKWVNFKENIWALC